MRVRNVRLRLQAPAQGLEFRRLFKVCAAKVAVLPLPEPFTIPALVAAMETARGRSIRLVAVEDSDEDLRAACGLRVRRDAITYVLYRPKPTPHQTEHTILHELAHEWLDHGAGPQAGPGAHSESRLQAMGTGTDARQIVQARYRYESTEEREAELSAYLIKQRVQAPPPGADLVSRLESSLSRPLGRRLAGRHGAGDSEPC